MRFVYPSSISSASSIDLTGFASTPPAPLNKENPYFHTGIPVPPHRDPRWQQGALNRENLSRNLSRKVRQKSFLQRHEARADSHKNRDARKNAEGLNTHSSKARAEMPGNGPMPGPSDHVPRMPSPTTPAASRTRDQMRADFSKPRIRKSFPQHTAAPTQDKQVPSPARSLKRGLNFLRAFVPYFGTPGGFIPTPTGSFSNAPGAYPSSFVSSPFQQVPRPSSPPSLTRVDSGLSDDSSPNRTPHESSINLPSDDVLMDEDFSYGTSTSSRTERPEPFVATESVNETNSASQLADEARRQFHFGIHREKLRREWYARRPKAMPKWAHQAEVEAERARKKRQAEGPERARRAAAEAERARQAAMEAERARQAAAAEAKRARQAAAAEAKRAHQAAAAEAKRAREAAAAAEAERAREALEKEREHEYLRKRQERGDDVKSFISRICQVTDELKNGRISPEEYLERCRTDEPRGNLKNPAGYYQKFGRGGGTDQSSTRRKNNRRQFHPYATAGLHRSFSRNNRYFNTSHVYNADAAPQPAPTPTPPVDPLQAQFNRYERLWKKISSPANEGDGLAFDNIPWPLLKQARSAEDVTEKAIIEFLFHEERTKAVKKRVVREELLRWHPDKFLVRVLSRISDPAERERVRVAADVVSRVLTDIK